MAKWSEAGGQKSARRGTNGEVEVQSGGQARGGATKSGSANGKAGAAGAQWANEIQVRWGANGEAGK
jgi:hypothetical protein